MSDNYFSISKDKAKERVLTVLAFWPYFYLLPKLDDLTPLIVWTACVVSIFVYIVARITFRIKTGSWQW